MNGRRTVVLLTHSTGGVANPSKWGDGETDKASPGQAVSAASPDQRGRPRARGASATASRSRNAIIEVAARQT